jgi:hypothetical protein
MLNKKFWGLFYYLEIGVICGKISATFCEKNDYIFGTTYSSWIADYHC